jgi:hypothetical protein
MVELGIFEDFGLWTLDFGPSPLEVRAVLKKYERWTI